MKSLLLLSIILAAISAPVHAATIQAYATNVSTTYGSFSATPGGAALSDADIQTIISSDANTAIFGHSAADHSVIDLDFDGTTVFTGSGAGTLGADLVVFSLWRGYDYAFGLQAFDTDGNSLSSYNYNVTSGTPGANVKTTSINLFSNTSGLALDDGIEIGYIRLFIGGNTFNGADGGLDAYSNFSLVGAYHTEATVVPLPLPAILFGSGLGLLGLIGRRKSKT